MWRTLVSFYSLVVLVSPGCLRTRTWSRPGGLQVLGPDEGEDPVEPTIHLSPLFHCDPTSRSFRTRPPQFPAPAIGSGYQTRRQNAHTRVSASLFSVCVCVLPASH